MARGGWLASLLVGVVLAGCLSAPPPEPVAPAAAVPDVRPPLEAPVFGLPALLGRVDFGAEPNIVVGADQDVYVVTPLRLWRSADGGATFEELGQGARCQVVFVEPPACPPGFEHPDPGLDGGGDGDMTADGAGNLYWAGLFGQAGPIPFQVSRDHGATWTSAEVFPTGATPSLGSNGGSHIFPVAAVDAAGTVYVVFSTDDPAPAPLSEVTFPVVRLTVSRDGGAAWSEPRAISAQGKTAIFPWIAAGKPGRVAVAWYENRLGAPSDVAPDAWDVVLQESVTADGEAPEFRGGPVNRDPIHLGILGTESPYRQVDRSLLDFFEIAIRADGQPVLAWVADTVPPHAYVEVHAAAAQEGTPLR
ncbi:MAG TPA: sialidase family protein [Candidatus Thermoplasmatota archaeon]|jgi:hypothetical protein|nr:sialidase family protein [Candidatus Thermoplasmatota archaeon]